MLSPRPNCLDVIEVKDLVIYLLSDTISENSLLSEINPRSLADKSQNHQQPASQKL